MIQELKIPYLQSLLTHQQRVGALLSKILAPVVQFSIIETSIYINVLELKSILFGLKSSYDHICDSYIKTRYDNLTAVHCINNMGSWRSVDCEISLEWTIKRKLWLSSVHILNTQNKKADQKS